MSGWITRTRERSGGKKRKKEKANMEGDVNGGEQQIEEGREEGLAKNKAPEKCLMKYGITSQEMIGMHLLLKKPNQKKL